MIPYIRANFRNSISIKVYLLLVSICSCLFIDCHILSHMFWHMHTYNNVYMYILAMPFLEQPNFAQWEQGIVHIDHPLKTSRECIRFMPQPGPSPTRPNHRAASLQTVNLPVWHLGGCIRAWIQMVGRIFMRWMHHAESDEQSKRG